MPALVVHGPDDTFAPWAASRALADRRPDMVTLHTVPGARHAAMWNADPARYEESPEALPDAAHVSAPTAGFGIMGGQRRD